MWWIALIALAVIAFFVVKMMKSQTERQQSEHARLNEVSGLQGTLDQTVGNSAETASATTTSSDAGHSANSNTAKAAGTAAVAGVAGAAASMASSSQSAASGITSQALDTGNAGSDVQEMIKILNLAAPDAGRLGISSDQLLALRHGDTSALADEKLVGDVASRLRSMLD